MKLIKRDKLNIGCQNTKNTVPLFLLACIRNSLFVIVFSGTLLYSFSSFSRQMNRHLASTSDIKRYTDNGDGTVTDSKTDLMWLQMDSYLHKKKWMTWFESKDYVRLLNQESFAGYDDWRIPELEELRSLYEANKLNSSQIGREMKIHIDPVFAKKGSGSLWSSKENGRFNAYGVIFNNGRSFSHSKTSRSRKAVRAVRNAMP